MPNKLNKSMRLMSFQVNIISRDINYKLNRNFGFEKYNN